MLCSPVSQDWINIHGNLVILRPLTFFFQYLVYFHVHKVVSVALTLVSSVYSNCCRQKAYWVSTVTRDKCNRTIMERNNALSLYICSATTASPFLLSHIHIRSSTYSSSPLTHPVTSALSTVSKDCLERRLRNPFRTYDKPQNGRKVERGDVISM